MHLTRKIVSGCALAAALLLSQCGTSVHYIRPTDLRTPERRDSVIQEWAPHFKGMTVFLDPGHGGTDRAGVGPAEDVVEADVNLRVALALRDYLMHAGANVVMSRETDASVPLNARAQQANVHNADVFISIHHNATENTWTNYTTTFYHARSGDMGYKASSQDLARYIQRDLSYVMGNPGPLVSFDGTMSDYDIHPNEGFLVLRETKMTSVLVECGFFSSSYEEQRLRRPEFNDIEAWGIFRGLAKYFRAGIPVLRYASPLVFATPRPKIEIEVNDKSDIPDESVRVFINEHEEGFAYNRKTRRITLTPAEDLSDGYHLLAAQVRNSGGNSSSPFELYFAVGRPPVALRSSAEPVMLPKDEGAYSIVTITAVDSLGNAVPDGLPLRFQASNGIDTMLALRNGSARIALYPGSRPRVTFSATNGPVRTEGAITTSDDALYTRGIVMGADGKAVKGAQVLLPGGRSVETGEGGEYIVAGMNPRGIEIGIHAPGWFGRQEALTPAIVQDPIVLSPVASGVLHGRTVLVELFTATAEKDGSRLDARTVRMLAELLEASGAKPVLLHTAANRKERDELLAKYKDALVLQFGEQTRGKVSLRVNGQTVSTKFASSLQRLWPQYVSAGCDKMVQRVQPSTEIPKRTQLAVLFPRVGSRGFDERTTPLIGINAAWAVYQAVLLDAGYKTAGTRSVEVSVVEKATGKPAAFAMLVLNGTLHAMTDARGMCTFRSVSINQDDVRPVDAERFEVKAVKTDVE